MATIPTNTPDTNFHARLTFACVTHIFQRRASSQKSIVSRTESIFDLPRFTRKIVPRPGKCRREYSRVPFVLTCRSSLVCEDTLSLIDQRTYLGSKAGKWRIYVRVLTSRRYGSVWLLDGHVPDNPLLPDIGSSRYIQLFRDKVTSYTSFFSRHRTLFISFRFYPDMSFTNYWCNILNASQHIFCICDIILRSLLRLFLSYS